MQPARTHGQVHFHLFLMIKIALAQQDFPVGDMTGNLVRTQTSIALALAKGADLIVFPEMAISGYPPEDLLLRPGFMRRCHDVMEELVAGVHGIDVVIGHPWTEGGERFNAVSWVRDGRVLGRYFKQALPNYAVFDERRYFSSGTQPLVIGIKGSRVGVIICEDAWVTGPASSSKSAGAELLLVPNASPFRDNKLAARLDILSDRLKECGLPMIYNNLVGGQDELVFDGRSILMNTRGGFSICANPCEESLPIACFTPESGDLWFEGFEDRSNLDGLTVQQDENITACIYTVLVRGLKDYIVKNGFTDVVLGLSGGIDSALTLALAVDALGCEHVHAVMMPSRHTSELSLVLAREQAEMLQVAYREIPIEPAFGALLGSLEIGRAHV